MTIAAGWEPVADAFTANLAEHGETGAAVCVYHDGEEVVHLVGGDYPDDGIQVVRSVTKGVAAIVAHLLHQRGVLDFDAEVSDVWPELAAAKGRRFRVRWLFSHQAGLSAIDPPALGLADVQAWDPVVEALERQEPLWEPGSAHGYHALTYGWLVGEVIRRVSGRTITEHVADELAAPLGLDLWVGLPASELSRVVELRPAPPPGPDDPPDPLVARLADPTGIAARSFSNPALFAFEHTPEYLASEVAAANGVTNARSLARLYAACIGAVDGVRILDDATLATASVPQASGIDMVTGYETRYATGFMRPFPLRPFGGLGTACVGHYGMGGPLGFCDPETGVAFGFTSAQIQAHQGPDPRSKGLAEAALACARGQYA